MQWRLCQVTKLVRQDNPEGLWTRCYQCLECQLSVFSLSMTLIDVRHKALFGSPETLLWNLIKPKRYLFIYLQFLHRIEPPLPHCMLPCACVSAKYFVVCFLPAGAINSELARNASTLTHIIMKPITSFFFKNTVQGCQSTLHCALQEGIEPLNGRYFSNCTVRKVYSKAKDDGAAKKLWEISERMCGLA